jgi:hypothetical protein
LVAKQIAGKSVNRRLLQLKHRPFGTRFTTLSQWPSFIHERVKEEPRIANQCIAQTPSAYGFPLLIKALLGAGVTRAPKQEIVSANGTRLTYQVFATHQAANNPNPDRKNESTLTSFRNWYGNQLCFANLGATKRRA